jgi:proteasome lid subunit RPN8/RPN11
MIVEIAIGIVDRLLAEAVATPHREICGLLFGDGNRIESAEPTPNVAADPARTFEIDPAFLFRAIRAERQGGSRLIGHYHSHPNGRAEPSPRDLAAAEPGKYWLIIGGGEARLWLAEQDGFREVKMIVNQDRASTA